MTSLPSPVLRKVAAGNGQEFLTLQATIIGQMLEPECRRFLLVDLAQVVADSFHLQPATLRIDHCPGSQVVERRAPQHGLLAAGVHGDVAADARGIRRGRVTGKDAAGFFGALHDTTRDHAGPGADRRVGFSHAWQRDFRHRAHVEQLLGVDDDRARRQGYRATGVTRAAAARDDRQAELDATAHQQRNLGFGIGRQHDKRIFDTPVGSIGDMRDTRQAVKADVVLARMA